jgi:spore coat polysaccharide biosynthesis protein SpsF
MYKTEQENFWASSFGEEYVDRNISEEYVISSIRLFADIFKHCAKVQSIIEFGANIGLNIKAIRQLMPFSRISAIEINKKAVKMLSEIDRGGGQIFHSSILNVKLKQEYDFAFTKGVLIHVNPNELQNVYGKLYECVKPGGYIMIAEYYNPTPVVVEYKGNKDKLFKRDFAGELMDKYSDVELIDYGFMYHRKNYCDDMNWFLMRKNR